MRSSVQGMRILSPHRPQYVLLRTAYNGGHMAQTTTNEQSVQPTDKLYMENTLLRVFGALFCHDAKRARARTKPIEINKGAEEKHLTIRLDSEYGQPGPFAYKVAMAVIKKQSNYGRPVQRKISFSERE